MTEIYDDYYDDLPEEEKIAIDAIQSRIDTLESGTAGFGKRYWKITLNKFSKTKVRSE